MQIRTLPEAAQILKKEDPGTCLTLTALRRMVKEGRIPSVTVGNKRLIDLDKLEEHLYTHPITEPMSKKGIKPIPE